MLITGKLADELMTVCCHYVSASATHAVAPKKSHPRLGFVTKLKAFDISFLFLCFLLKTIMANITSGDTTFAN